MVASSFNYTNGKKQPRGGGTYSEDVVQDDLGDDGTHNLQHCRAFGLGIRLNAGVPSSQSTSGLVTLH